MYHTTPFATSYLSVVILILILIKFSRHALFLSKLAFSTCQQGYFNVEFISRFWQLVSKTPNELTP